MAPHADSESSSLKPPDRPRAHIVIGLVIAAALLAALIWFSVTHTATDDLERSIYGVLPAPWGEHMARA